MAHIWKNQKKKKNWINYQSLGRFMKKKINWKAFPRFIYKVNSLICKTVKGKNFVPMFCVCSKLNVKRDQKYAQPLAKYIESRSLKDCSNSQIFQSVRTSKKCLIFLFCIYTGSAKYIFFFFWKCYWIFSRISLFIWKYNPFG